MLRILLAEDEIRMASALMELLKQEGYDVDVVNDGFSALSALESDLYDAAVLDVMMPEMNGYAVVSKARKKKIHTPVMLLTAKGELEDKVTGLDSGADDYLTKPFEIQEFLARLRALLRRIVSYQDDSVSYGDLLLDQATATLKCIRTAQSVRLGEKEEIDKPADICQVLF